jgi:hypothetical protein
MGLQNLLEDYRNWTKTQEWKNKKQEEQLFGGDPQLQEDFDKLSSGFGPSNLGGGLSGLAGAIKTYHGTPRAEPFTKFNKEFIRKGVYGEGHYFAENPLESKKYSELQGPMFEDGKPQHSIYEVSLEWPDAAKESLNPLSKEHFFQWDKTFKNQPEHIRGAMEEIIQENPNMADDYIQFLTKQGSAGWTLKDLLNKRPEMLIKYGGMEPHMMDRGIPGVAFRDQVTSSRPVSEKTYNYAVFGDKIPRIISHNKPSVLDLVWPNK